MEGIYAGYVYPVTFSVPSPLLRTQEGGIGSSACGIGS